MRFIGHRGASAIERENTIRALRRAFDDGADGVELDVRPCQTGELVVLHDPTLGRVWGDPRAVRSLELRELRRIAPDLPTLDEVWDEVGTRGILHVEVKSNVVPFHAVPQQTSESAPWWTTAEAVRRWTRRRGLSRSPGGLFFSSFDPRILLFLAIGVRRVPRALLFETTQGYPVPPITLARAAACRAIHPEYPLVTADLCAGAHRRRMEVNVWTVDDDAEIVRLGGLGVDGVICNDPRRARAAFQSRS